MVTSPRSAPSVVTRAERALGVVLAVVSGATIAVQSRINGELGVRLDDGVFAALISFGVGLGGLVILTPLVPQARQGLRLLRDSLAAGALPHWYYLGGVGGAALVATQGLTVGVLGVAVFVVAVVAGQTGSSLLVDRAGLGPGGRQPVTWPRLIGAALTLLAVAGAMSGRIDGTATLWLGLAPLVAGCGIAVQQAVNGQVRHVTGSALTATLVNFLVGTTALALTWAVVRIVVGPPNPLPREPWLYVGGILGAAFIGVAAFVVRWTGVLLFGLATIAGQLAGAVLLDLLVPAPGVQVQAATLIGTALTLVAVAVAALPGSPIRRSSTRRREAASQPQLTRSTEE